MTGLADILKQVNVSAQGTSKSGGGQVSLPIGGLSSLSVGGYYDDEYGQGLAETGRASGFGLGIKKRF